jgi:hypothetical protein
MDDSTVGDFGRGAQLNFITTSVDARKNFSARHALFTLADHSGDQSISEAAHGPAY